MSDLGRRRRTRVANPHVKRACAVADARYAVVGVPPLLAFYRGDSAAV